LEESLVIFSIREIEEEAVRRIQSIDTTNYRQGGFADSLTLSDIPLSSEFDPQSVAHLRFEAGVVSTSNTFRERDKPGFFAVATSRLAVLFTYRLRIGRRVEDQRLAAQLAVDICREINKFQNDVESRVIDFFQPALSPDGEWLSVACTIDITHELQL
jgi:hypothetical protein